MLLTDTRAQPAGCRSDRGQRRPHAVHAGEPGTELALSTQESLRSRQSVRPACRIGLRPLRLAVLDVRAEGQGRSARNGVLLLRQL